MPYKDYNKKMAEYMLRRYHQRRAEALEKLGNRCSVCGTQDDLEIDHINPKQKSFGIGKLWSVSQKRLDAEIAKCQLLCEEHHLEKSLEEGSFHKSPIIRPKGVKHGTVHGYSKYRCRCEDCKQAKREYEKARIRKKQELGA